MARNVQAAVSIVNGVNKRAVEKFKSTNVHDVQLYHRECMFTKREALKSTLGALYAKARDLVFSPYVSKCIALHFVHRSFNFYLRYDLAPCTKLTFILRTQYSITTV